MQRKSARRLSIEYGIALALSYIIAVIDAAAILIPLRGQMSAAANGGFFEKNMPTLFVLPVLGIVCVVAAGICGAWLPRCAGMWPATSRTPLNGKPRCGLPAAKR